MYQTTNICYFYGGGQNWEKDESKLTLLNSILILFLQRAIIYISTKSNNNKNLPKIKTIKKNDFGCLTQ